MKKLVLAALLAAASTSAQAAVVISFTGTSFADGSAFTGTLTIDTAALPGNTATPPDTSYNSTASFMTLSVSGGSVTPVLFGTTTDSTIYSDASGGEFSQQRDGGGSAYSFFYLYNSAYDATPSAVFDGVLLPDFRALPDLTLNFESNDGTTTSSLTGAIRITGYDVTAGAVPESATWAMMVGGFGMVGYGLRRRKVSFATA